MDARERALTDTLRRARGDDTAAATLPWWDWSSNVAHAQGVPTAFQPTENATNPLGAGPVVLGPSDLQLVRDNLPGAISDGDEPVTLRIPMTPMSCRRSNHRPARPAVHDLHRLHPARGGHPQRRARLGRW